MMPLAPTMTELPTPTRPKIGFSIDSIVGGKTHNNNNRSPSPLPQNHKRQRHNSSEGNNDHDGGGNGSYRSHSSSPETPPISAAGHLHRSQLLGNYSPAALAFFRDSYLKSNVIVNHHAADQRRRSTDSVHSNTTNSPTTSPLASPKINTTVTCSNSVIKGPVSPSTPGSTTGGTSTSASSTTVTNNSPSIHRHPQHPRPEIHHPPFSLLGGAPHGAVPYPPGILNFAALAAAAAQQHQHPGQHPLAWMQQAHLSHHPHHPPGHPLHHAHPGSLQHGGPHTHPPMSTSHPLYPWLLAKHSRLFPHRFGPGGPELPGFLLQPFRKPKRIRTAFSPSQLLKLEHAFERNHYVVGAERKQLANNLSLTETQVKVWFQNRRTKHKRIEQDEEASPTTNSSSKSGSGGGGHGHGGSSSTATADSSTNARARYGSRVMMSGDEDDDIDDDDEDEDVLMDDEEEEAERQAYLARIAQQRQQLHSSQSVSTATTASQIPSSSQSPSSSSPGSNNSNHHNLAQQSNHYPHSHRRPS